MMTRRERVKRSLEGVSDKVLEMGTVMIAKKTIPMLNSTIVSRRMQLEEFVTVLGKAFVDAEFESDRTGDHKDPIELCYELKEQMVYGNDDEVELTVKLNVREFKIC